MTNLLSSLQPFETILLLMGVVIFLILAFLLIWNVVKQRAIISLLPFFLVPVILVGYPSIQSVQFSKDSISLQKYTQAVTSNPSDTVARKELSDRLAIFKQNKRASGNADALVTIAEAQQALGRLDSASLTLHKASSLFPHSANIRKSTQEVSMHIKARQVFNQQVIQLRKQLEELQASPQDTIITTNITHILTGLRQPAYVDASSALVIARAYAVMKQPGQSMKVIDKVLEADPTSAQAKSLKNDVMNHKPVNTHVTPFQQKALQKTTTVNGGVFKAIVKDKE